MLDKKATVQYYKYMEATMNRQELEGFLIDTFAKNELDERVIKSAISDYVNQAEREIKHELIERITSEIKDVLRG